MCVPGGASAHTDGSAVRVCGRAPLGCVGREAEETVRDVASRTRLPLLLMPPACRARPRSTATERECDPRRENGVLGSQHRSLHPLPSKAETQPPPPWILRVAGSLPRRLPRGVLPPSPLPPGTGGGVGTGERSSTRPLLTHLSPHLSQRLCFPGAVPGRLRCEGRPEEGWVCRCTHPKGEREGTHWGRRLRPPRSQEGC